MTSVQLVPLIAAGWMLYTTGVHAVLGGERVAAPLDASGIAAFPRATLLVVWHAVTWLFLTLAAAMAAAAFAPSLRVLVPFAALQLVGFSAVFLVVARRALGASIRLPQWFLLGPLALTAGATMTSRPAALAVVAILGVIGLVHALWAAGITWPARDRRELAWHVIGRPASPGGLACLVVAGILAVFAAGFATTSDAGWVRAVRIAVVVVFAGRGVFGLVETRMRPAVVGTPYETYSRFMYSPLCVLVAALAAATLVG